MSSYPEGFCNKGFATKLVKEINMPKTEQHPACVSYVLYVLWLRIVRDVNKAHQDDYSVEKHRLLLENQVCFSVFLYADTLQAVFLCFIDMGNRMNHALSWYKHQTKEGGLAARF